MLDCVNQHFHIRPRISERAAYDLVAAMALHGNHGTHMVMNLHTVKDIRDYCSRHGMEFKAVVSACRDFTKPIPFFENLARAQRTTENVSVSVRDHITGEWVQVAPSGGMFNLEDYWALFEHAQEDFHLALQNATYERFLAAVNLGLAAIEAFMNQQFMVLAAVRSDDEALKSDLEKKIIEWIPRFTGNRFETGSRDWAAFKLLKTCRNEDFQHRKSIASGIGFRQLVDLLNQFKLGICRVLLKLHQAFSRRCPACIIRYSYFPQIEYVRHAKHDVT
jgi:hypothetical protein